MTKRKPLTRVQLIQLMLDQEGKCGCGCGVKLDALLRSLVEYDPETGGFTWLRRRESGFASPGSARSWNRKFAGKPAFTMTNAQGYLVGRIHGQRITAHRSAWLISHGTQTLECLDHINGDRADNRLANLREVSKAENARNAKRRVDNTSGIAGVHFHRGSGKWRAQLSTGGRLIHLGLFAHKDEAAAARKAALSRYGFSAGHGSAR